MKLGPRRGRVIDVQVRPAEAPTESALRDAEMFDELHRGLCALLFNYVPTSGHPGGSISSGRLSQALVFDAMDYDLSQPDRHDADVLSYAAGHKALGLYALWALRNEVARIAAPELLPRDERLQLRLEDLLGFRRSPALRTPLAGKLRSRTLDGHPTPATPFVRLATGASGVGLGASLGFALAAADAYGKDAPRVHIVEGEGGLTPGRVAEALAAAGTASLGNAFVHVDWNQSSIDSDHVCREGDRPGDYVQWDPAELFALHDWNVVRVPDGRDLRQIHAAQRAAFALAAETGQPTAIIYRTVKGWRYGIEGKASHGAGHKLCSEHFFKAMLTVPQLSEKSLPVCPPGESRCEHGANPGVIEECFWEALLAVRRALEEDQGLTQDMAARLWAARERLHRRARGLREGAPRADAIFEEARAASLEPPRDLQLQPGKSATLRGELARVLHHYAGQSGAVLCAAADLLGSTSISGAVEGSPGGYFNARTNPRSRTVPVGGICEDAMTALLAGASTFGRHLGVGASYGAFLAPLGHIAARLHAIGAQARRALSPDEPYRTVVLACAHAGPKTGEDGPTHADPQALQIVQQNFPAGTAITLTPWEPQELWPLMTAALARRPAVLLPFVTRPPEKVLDRASLGLAPASASAQGLYRLRAVRGFPDAVVVLQGSAVAYAFVQDALPLLERAGVSVEAWYVSSAELFDALPERDRNELWPEERARVALGITDFTLPTLWRWVTSEKGRAASLHPFRCGHYLGSGTGAMVLQEAGLDGQSQFVAIRDFAER